jgi:hypothetical protein
MNAFIIDDECANTDDHSDSDVAQVVKEEEDETFDLFD